jgi:hypothetical protein
VNGFREFPGARRAAAELGEDLPYLELRVRALAGGAEFRVGAVGLFLGLGLVLALVRDLRPGAALVALVREGDQSGSLQFIKDAPDPLGLLIVDRAGSAPETRWTSPRGLAMTCRFIPCFLCLPE